MSEENLSLSKKRIRKLDLLKCIVLSRVTVPKISIFGLEFDAELNFVDFFGFKNGGVELECVACLIDVGLLPKCWSVMSDKIF